MPMTRKQQKWLAEILLAHGGGQSVPVAFGGQFAGGGPPGDDPAFAATDAEETPAPQQGNGRPPAQPRPATAAAPHPATSHPAPPQGRPGPSSAHPGATGGKTPAGPGSGGAGPLGSVLPAIVKAVDDAVQGAVKAVQGAGIGAPLVQPDLAGTARKVVQGIVEAARKKAEGSGVDPASLEKHAKELLKAAEERIAAGVKTVAGVVGKVEKARKDLEASKAKMAEDAKKTVDGIKKTLETAGEKILDTAVDGVREVAKDVGLAEQEKQLEAAAKSVADGAKKAVQGVEQAAQTIAAKEKVIADTLVEAGRSVERQVEQGVKTLAGDAEAAVKSAVSDLFG